MAAAAAAANTEPSYGMDKLSYEIFSILESKFLFGCNPPPPEGLDAYTVRPSAPATPARGAATPSAAGGRVRVLSVDAGGSTSGLLAAASLARMEARLQLISGDPAARISDFFDLAAGSGAGGVLVALLFTRVPGHRQISATEAVHFLTKYYKEFAKRPIRRSGPLRRLLGNGEKGIVKVLKKALGESTLRDTVKPVLIPCYDLATGAPFVFSRADAVETEGYDFRMWEVCAATMGAAAASAAAGGMRSVDGRTGIAAAAVDGGVATGNPTAAAVTHVLNNRREFPAARGVEDLLLVSLGNGECGGGGWRPGSATPTTAGIVRIAGEGVSDMIDQAVAMAFGQSRTTSYVRIQGRDLNPSPKPNTSTNPSRLLHTAEEMLSQKNVESVLFLGKKLSQKTNIEKLEWAAEELLKEQDRRSRCPFPVVVFKQGSPRSSSSSALSSSSSSSP